VSSPQASYPRRPADLAEADRQDAVEMSRGGDAVTAPFARALDALCAGLFTSAEPAPRVLNAAPRRVSDEREQRSSVACGLCAGRIALGDFVFIGGGCATRTADCPQCGATTAISLV